MSDTPIINSLLAVLHVLAGAAWFGAMIYSFFVLHPRAHAFFKRPADFESFITAVSAGARYSVLSALALIALSGVGLAVIRWPHPVSVRWLLLIGAKVGLFLAALGVFVYVSWRLWPARLFASTEEISHFQALFRRVALTMITLAGLSMTLGVLAHTW